MVPVLIWAITSFCVICPKRIWSVIPCKQLLTIEFLSGPQLNLSIRDVVNSCFISTRIKEVPYEPQVDVVVCVAVLCLGQEFWGTPVSPYLNFRGTFANSGGHTKFHLIFTCKIKNSFPEISVLFYLHLSLMTIVLAQEGVQITVK